VTAVEIGERLRLETLKHSVARAIRILLDEAAKEYGPEAWEDDGVEGEVLDLVGGEG
jgi:hypothetical protein